PMNPRRARSPFRTALVPALAALCLAAPGRADREGGAPARPTPAQAPPSGTTRPLYDLGAARPDPHFNPPPACARPGASYAVGDQVTVGGPGVTNYYPNLLMDVYVHRHRVWREGDSLRAGAVHRSRVKSDAKGNLPRTNLWRPDRPGVYDVI